jgi:galactokinase/mevalonate kinase-like predicted kinase
MAQRDVHAFAQCVNAAWELNKRLDPESTNAGIEALLARVQPRIRGAKLLGAGGGGFLFLIANSPEDAAALRSELDADPPNSRARFFEFGVNQDGLRVTAC